MRDTISRPCAQIPPTDLDLDVKDVRRHGRRPGRLIQWHPGGGHHGPNSYWKYNSDSGRILSILNQTVDAGVFGAPVTEIFGYTNTNAPHAVTGVTGGPETKSFVYDDAGRMTERSIGTVDTDLVWDVMSNLVSTTATPLATEPDEVYVYDASGQRVAKISLLNDTATAYFGATEVTDPDTATTATGDLAATRYYTFAGATVAVQAPDASTTAVGGWSYLFGDFQGSAQLMMEVAVNAAGVVTAAAGTDVVTRNAYTPYGARRGVDELSVERDWLSQVADNDTGLTYLNARYYDPALGRFLSPDPLGNVFDPRTLDPYRYSENNPVTFSDPSGLCTVTKYGLTLSCDAATNLATQYVLNQNGGSNGSEDFNANVKKAVQAIVVDHSWSQSNMKGPSSHYVGKSDSELMAGQVPGSGVTADPSFRR